jgi:hypothetical protein
MPKNAINQYSTTAGSNTDVGGVDLAENSMQPSDVNNAIRTLMSHLAAFQAGSDTITKLAIGNWTIEQDASNNLLLSYSGTGVAKIASNGAITSADDVTAFGTI